MRYVVGLLLAACYVIIWNLSHLYRGLDHDAHLYALQALARLHPQLYANDIFFRFGSQDSYTVFTSIYAALIAWLGVDNAASLLTLASTALYFYGAWLVSRRLSGSTTAWLATGLLIVVELYYGGFSVFKTAEEFLTARLPAEALSLFAIAAWFSGQRAICVGLLVCAALIHPLMAVPATALIALLAIPRHFHGRLYAAAAIGFAGVLAIALLAPTGPIRLVDDEWLSIIRLRSYYLFPTSWTLDGWSRTAVVVATLALGALARPSGLVADTCRATLAVCVIGMLLTGSTEVWPLQILIQGQPWRWLWLGSVIALLCLPSIVRTLWSDRAAGRAVAVMLCVSWLMLEMSGGLLAPLAVALWALRARMTGRTARWLNALAIGIAVVTVVWSLSNVHTVLQWQLDLGKEPLVIETARNVFGLTAPAVAAVISLWLIATRAPARVAMLVMTALLAALVPLVAHPNMHQWTQRAFARSAYVDFADWRTLVAPGTEVLWLWNPVATWLLLERPSYMSVSQSAGLLFSRPLALEIDRRTRVLEPLGDKGLLIVGKSETGSSRPFTLDALAGICRDDQLGFVVAGTEVGPAAGKHEWPRHGQFVWLYDCRTYRADGAAT
ncbi:MAG TPA: hypothetical protein PLE54_07180 [Burkholderiaceae bacterium]|nr:hypothetical protein [Burkholderiaceae bacterium]